MNSRLRKVIAAGVAVGALAVGGTAIAGSVGSDDGTGTGDDGPGTPVRGAALERASRIALDRVGSGRVTGTELRDEEGYYEIEVTRDDGSQVDVHLDSRFHVLDTSADGR